MKRGKPLQRSPMKRTCKARNSERGLWRSAAYIAWVGGKFCCIPGCGKPPGPPHHLLRGTDKCGGRTASDWWAVPMCHEHHHALHMDGNETRFMAEHGIDDGPALAMAQYEMWKENGNG